MKAKLLSLGAIARRIERTRGQCSKQAVAKAITRHKISPAAVSAVGHNLYSPSTARFLGERLRQPNTRRVA